MTNRTGRTVWADGPGPLTTAAAEALAVLLARTPDR